MNAEPSSSKSTLRPFHRVSRLLLIAMTLYSLGVLFSVCMASSVEEDDKLIAPSASILKDDDAYVAEVTDAGRYRVSTRFKAFSGESLALDFDMKADDSRRAFEEFGFNQQELDQLRDDCNAAASCDQKELARNTARYYRKHALRLTPDPGKPSRLSVDVAEVVNRNRARVQPVAEALKRLARERGYDRQWMIETAIALVQSGLPYRKPPASADGRSLLGFYPPPMALERGYGDCDTKSALLAAILMNLGAKQIVGVHIPNHYLLGIAGTPQEGEASVFYEGKTYVLVEAAGPARRQPGRVSEFTQVALKQQTGLRIDPMF